MVGSEPMALTGQRTRLKSTSMAQPNPYSKICASYSVGQQSW